MKSYSKDVLLQGVFAPSQYGSYPQTFVQYPLTSSPGGVLILQYFLQCFTIFVLQCFREVWHVMILEAYTQAWPPPWSRHPQLSNARKHGFNIIQRQTCRVSIVQLQNFLKNPLYSRRQLSATMRQKVGPTWYAEKSCTYWWVSDNAIETDGRGRLIVPDQFSSVADWRAVLVLDHITARFHTICRGGSHPLGLLSTTTRLRRSDLSRDVSLVVARLVLRDAIIIVPTETLTKTDVLADFRQCIHPV